MSNPAVREKIDHTRTLLRANRPQEALALCQEACQQYTGEIELWLMLGALHAQLGDPAAAEDALRKVIALRPDMTSAHFNLGVSLREQRKLADAANSFRAALKLDPHAADTHNALAYVLAAHGQVEDAERHFRKAIELDPAFADAYNNLGNILQATSRHEEAIDCYTRSAAAQPAHLDAMRNLAGLLASMGRIEEAIDWDRRIIDLSPDSAGVHFHLGNLLVGVERLEEAVESYRNAWRTKPGFGKALAAEANTLQKLGRFEEASARIVNTLDQGFENPAIIATAAELAKRLDRQEDIIGQAEVLLRRTGYSNEERQQLHFAAGKLYDDLGRHQDAFEHFRLGNSLYRGTFMRHEHDRLVRDSIALFQPFRAHPLPRSRIVSDRPVFIVGMPRSGTSLVEQILASHPRIHGGGELNTINQYANEMQARSGSGTSYPGCLKDVHPDLLDSLAQQYLDRLEGMDESAWRVTDKMPHNFLHLGMISLLFPGARIIHVRRNPMDTCLSIYFQKFNELHAYAHDLSDLGFYYQCYEKLMAHWRTALHLPLLEVHYEDLVQDPATWIPRLVEFCDLEWDDRCMRFHETRRAVNTPSHEQVREPMYTRSVQRWRHYEEELTTLKEALGNTLPG